MCSSFYFHNNIWEFCSCNLHLWDEETEVWPHDEGLVVSDRCLTPFHQYHRASFPKTWTLKDPGENLRRSQTASTYHSGEYFLEPVCCSQGLGLTTHQAIFKFIQRLPHRVGIGDLGIVHKCDVSDAPTLHGNRRSWCVSDEHFTGCLPWNP